MHPKPTAFLSGIPVGVITGILEELQPVELFRNSSIIPLTSFFLAKFRPVMDNKENVKNLGPLFLFAAFDF